MVDLKMPLGQAPDLEVFDACLDAQDAPTG
jgi:hypothetical protein